jgi:hypothetical protein
VSEEESMIKNRGRDGQLIHFKASREGGEILTWMGAGAATGGIVGLVLGALFYSYLLGFPKSDVSGFLESVQASRGGGAGHLVPLIPVALVVVGALAGTLIGIGVPRFNPYSQQGHRAGKNTRPPLAEKIEDRQPVDIDALRHPEEQVYLAKKTK